MDLYYLVLLAFLWGLTFGIMALPQKAAKVQPIYSSWVDCASLIGDI